MRWLLTIVLVLACSLVSAGDEDVSRLRAQLQATQAHAYRLMGERDLWKARAEEVGRVAAQLVVDHGDTTLIRKFRQAGFPVGK